MHGLVIKFNFEVSFRDKTDKLSVFPLQNILKNTNVNFNVMCEVIVQAPRPLE